VIGDLLGFDMPAPAVSAPTSTTLTATRIALASTVTMTSEDCQAKWGAISDADSIRQVHDDIQWCSVVTCHKQRRVAVKDGLDL
jgi:hypothetical protein